MIMSYILNALRKAEKERQQKQEQNLSFQLQDIKSQQPSRNMMPWLVLLLSVNVVVLGYMFLKIDEPSQAIDGAERSERVQKSLVDAPVNKSVPAAESTSSSLSVMFDQQKQETKIAETEQQGKSAAPSLPNIESVDDIKTEEVMLSEAEMLAGMMPEENINFNGKLTKPVTPKSENKSATADSTVQRIAPKAKKLPPSGTDALKTALTQQDTPPEMNRAVVTTPKPLQTEKGSVRSASKAVQYESKNELPWLHELSRDFRRSVPDLNINVYVYNERPENRFIMIEMKKFQAGQEISAGMKLQEIQPDGIVVLFRGKRFKIKRA